MRRSSLLIRREWVGLAGSWRSAVVTDLFTCQPGINDAEHCASGPFQHICVSGRGAARPTEGREIYRRALGSLGHWWLLNQCRVFGFSDWILSRTDQQTGSRSQLLRAAPLHDHVAYRRSQRGVSGAARWRGQWPNGRASDDGCCVTGRRRPGDRASDGGWYVNRRRNHSGHNSHCAKWRTQYCQIIK